MKFLHVSKTTDTASLVNWCEENGYKLTPHTSIMETWHIGNPHGFLGHYIVSFEDLTEQQIFMFKLKWGSSNDD